LAAGVDIDCSRGKLYWSDTTNKLISMSSIDGSGVEVFLADGFRNRTYFKISSGLKPREGLSQLFTFFKIHFILHWKKIVLYNMFLGNSGIYAIFELRLSNFLQRPKYHRCYSSWILNLIHRCKIKFTVSFEFHAVFPFKQLKKILNNWKTVYGWKFMIFYVKYC